MKNGIFVSGTNTNIGKTFVCALLMAAAIQANKKIHYFKPVQTGDDSDSDTVKALAGIKEELIARPVVSLKARLAPYSAALAENKTIDPEFILQHWQQINSTPHIVEGAGGLLVPITKNYTIRELIKDFNLPLLIVASTKLGTINHTLLTIEAALKKEIPIVGIVLVGEKDPWLISTLNNFCEIPIVAEVPWFDSFENFYEQAIKVFTPQLLNKLL